MSLPSRCVAKTPFLNYVLPTCRPRRHVPPIQWHVRRRASALTSADPEGERSGGNDPVGRVTVAKRI